MTLIRCFAEDWQLIVSLCPATGSKNEAAAVPGVEEEKENQSRSDGDNEPVDCAQQESPPAPPSDLQGDRLPNIQNENLEGHPGENSTATEPGNVHRTLPSMTSAADCLIDTETCYWMKWELDQTGELVFNVLLFV